MGNDVSNQTKEGSINSVFLIYKTITAGAGQNINTLYLAQLTTIAAALSRSLKKSHGNCKLLLRFSTETKENGHCRGEDVFSCFVIALFFFRG